LNPFGVSWSVNKDFGVDINPFPNLVHIPEMLGQVQTGTPGIRKI
jgi:hypothetical protein